jgi:hypothetical protein
MTRLRILSALSIVCCVSAMAQIPRPSLACSGATLGKVPTSLTLILDPSGPTILNPGVPLRVLASFGGGDVLLTNNVPFPSGTYPGVEQCSLTSGPVSATFDIPIVVTITNTDQPRFSVSTPGFAGTFFLGAPGTLTLTLPAASGSARPIFFGTSEIVTFGRLLLTTTPPGTPLPPTIVLTLTGLAGIALLTARRKLRTHFT